MNSAVALLRWRNIWVKIAVLRNSRREAACEQRNTRFWVRNIFAAGEKMCCGLFFAVGERKKKRASILEFAVGGKKTHLFCNSL